MELWIWGAMCLVLILAEGFTMQLVSVWFAAGALAAFFTALFDGSFLMQLLVFTLTSGILLACTRPLVKKLMVKTPVATNADREIGAKATIIETVDNARGKGRARRNGVDWTAVSADESIIPEGTTVVIREIQGAKLVVAPEKVPVTNTKK